MVGPLLRAPSAEDGAQGERMMQSRFFITGLAATVTLAGTKFFKDDELN
jgi:hypothetical protein